MPKKQRKTFNFFAPAVIFFPKKLDSYCKKHEIAVLFIEKTN